MKKHDSTWNEEKKSMILKNNSNAVEANKDFKGNISDFFAKYLENLSRIFVESLQMSHSSFCSNQGCDIFF